MFKWTFIFWLRIGRISISLKRFRASLSVTSKQESQCGYADRRKHLPEISKKSQCESNDPVSFRSQMMHFTSQWSLPILHISLQVLQNSTTHACYIGLFRSSSISHSCNVSSPPWSKLHNHNLKSYGIKSEPLLCIITIQVQIIKPASEDSKP